MVYVIAKDDTPLMPCENVVARLLLKSGKAKVLRKCPFTIKLTYESTKYVQNLTLGIDTGSATIGAAASDDSGNIYYMSKTEIRNDITDKMKDRSKYRKNRRNRKTRHRPIRWLNRRSSIKIDRFSPTMTSKFNSHIREIEFVKSILPIKRLVLETGIFDPTLMKHEGEAFNRHWGYQKGTLYSFENVKAFVRDRDNYTCQCCSKKNCRIEVHHILFRSLGGSDEPENLISLCKDCHKGVHNGTVKLLLKGKHKGNLKHATQMNSIRIQLLKHYPEAIETFGYVTKANRVAVDLPKDHNFDACVIASDGVQPVFKTTDCVIKKCVSAGDYQRTKGVRSEQRIPTHKIMGFRKFDKVKYLGKEYFIKGRMSSGYATLMDIFGNKIDFSNMPKGLKTPKLANCKRIQARKTILCTIHPMAEVNGLLVQGG